MSSNLQPLAPGSNRVRIVVATSVMLTFISYWRAAAIILNDLGSSAFYAAGIAEKAVGKTAPWFVLAVMLFSFAVRAVYVESCSMFVRGGVYRVVKEALGGTLAKVSVSALMFDYVLTGPTSGVSAGQYIAGLVNATLAAMEAHGWVPRALHNLFGGTPHVNVNAMAVLLAAGVTLYYWWQNIKGIEESSEKAMRVMEITTVMVVLLLGWSAYTLLSTHGWSLPPLPRPLVARHRSIGNQRPVLGSNRLRHPTGELPLLRGRCELAHPDRRLAARLDDLLRQPLKLLAVARIERKRGKAINDLRRAEPA